jgi:peroxiredoxin
MALGQTQRVAAAPQRASAGKQASRPTAPRRRPAPPLERVPEEPNVIPPVLLTEQLQAASWFHVGDEFPDLRLPDAAGKTVSLAELTGGKLSLVVIWTPDHPYCREELADLPRFAAPAGEALRVVTICWGQPADAARDVVEALGFEYPVLVDAARQALPPKSPVMLPQTYLLDPQRKVLWCDLEYSRATRRQLAKALRVALEER